MDDKDLIKMTNKEAAEILKNIIKPRSGGGRKNVILPYNINTRMAAMTKAIALLEQTPDDGIIDYATAINNAVGRTSASDFSDTLQKLGALLNDHRLSLAERKSHGDEYLSLLYAHQVDVPKEPLSRDFDGDPPSINAPYFIQILKDTFGNWGYQLLIGCLRLNIPVYLYGIPATGKTLITRTLREAGFMISESGDYDKGPMYIPPITDDPIQPLVLQANYCYHPTIFLDFKPVADDIRKYILEEDLKDADWN